MNTLVPGSANPTAAPTAAEDRTQPVVGRIVECTVQISRSRVVTRPGIVVRAWSEYSIGDHPCAVNAQVFFDGDGSPNNDGCPNVVWKTSLKWDPSGTTPHTWRWPSRSQR